MPAEYQKNESRFSELAKNGERLLDLIGNYMNNDQKQEILLSCKERYDRSREMNVLRQSRNSENFSVVSEQIGRIASTQCHTFAFLREKINTSMQGVRNQKTIYLIAQRSALWICSYLDELAKGYVIPDYKSRYIPYRDDLVFNSIKMCISDFDSIIIKKMN